MVKLFLVSLHPPFSQKVRTNLSATESRGVEGA